MDMNLSTCRIVFYYGIKPFKVAFREAKHSNEFHYKCTYMATHAIKAYCPYKYIIMNREHGSVDGDLLRYLFIVIGRFRGFGSF